MSNMKDYLKKQLNSEYREDAEKVLEIYNHLFEMTGHVWQSHISILVDTIYKGFPSDDRRYELTAIGEMYLKGIMYDKNKKMESTS